LAADIFSPARDETRPLGLLSPSAKFPGEIYRATGVPGNVAGRWRAFAAKIFATAFSSRFQLPMRARARVHSIPPSRVEEGEGVTRTHACAARNGGGRAAREFVPIVFPANKRERSLVHRRRPDKIAKVRLKLRLRRGDGEGRGGDNRARASAADFPSFCVLLSRRIRRRFRSHRSNSNRKAAPYNIIAPPRSR